jgi:poly(3-hydroxybutyrate) depolymerase
VTYQRGNVTCETYSGCTDDADVTLCAMQGVSHCWPGQPFCFWGTPTTDIEGSAEIARFFARFSLP